MPLVKTPLVLWSLLPVWQENCEDEVDYYFWGGAANTFFMDKARDHIGTFAQLASSYNVSDNIEEIVDQAGL